MSPPHHNDQLTMCLTECLLYGIVFETWHWVRELDSYSDKVAYWARQLKMKTKVCIQWMTRRPGQGWWRKGEREGISDHRVFAAPARKTLKEVLYQLFGLFENIFLADRVWGLAWFKKIFFWIWGLIFGYVFRLGKTRLHEFFQIYRPINTSGPPMWSFNGNFNGKMAKNRFLAIKSSRSVLQPSSYHCWATFL